MIITRHCDICQVTYNADTKYLNRGQGKTCSRSCGQKLSSRLRKSSNIKPNCFCGFCHKEIYVKQSRINKSKSGLVFCSRACQDCAAALGMLQRGPIPTVGSKQVVQAPTRYQINVDEWLGGNNEATISYSRSGVPRDTKTFVKRYLIETRGDKCEQCGFTGKNIKTGNSIIQMDHINGQCFDNRLDNLRLLCPNCHAMTETYGSLNRGSGRTLRRRPTIEL